MKLKLETVMVFGYCCCCYYYCVYALYFYSLSLLNNFLSLIYYMNEMLFKILYIK